MGTATVTAQSAGDNIRPVGQVCLAGQSCVGTPARAGHAGGGGGAAPAAPVVQAPAEPEVVEAVVPVVAAPAAEAFDAAAAYQASCFACHATGAAGAPMLGDAEAWGARMEKGMGTVMANVINGLNAMPAKGLCMNCSDDDLRAIVDYMLAQ